MASGHLQRFSEKNVWVSRPSILFAKKHFKSKTNIIVEVGVWKGRHAFDMRVQLNPKHMYLIDSFDVKYPENKHNMNGLLENIDGFNDITFIRKFSHEAVSDVPDDIDLVYIDASHEYEDVKLDVESWLPKIRIGGIICGHDFNDANVRNAVTELLGGVSEGETDWWKLKCK